MKTIFIILLGMFIGLTTSCSSNSTSANTGVDNSGISKTTQPSTQSAAQTDMDSTTSQNAELTGNEKEILTNTFRDFIPYNPNFVDCIVDKTLEQADIAITDLLNIIEAESDKIQEYWQTFGPNCLSSLTEEEVKLLNSPLTDASGNPLIEETEEPGRIQFSTDDIGITLKGTFVTGDSSPNYVFQASEGQLLQLELITENPNANISLYGPNPIAIDSFTVTKMLLPDNGDYLFFINNLEPNNDYTVDILITDPTVQRVQFNAGETSTTLQGGILRGESGPVYLFQASAQQLLGATIITLEENASFDIIAPSGTLLAINQMNVERLLPETGDYLMQINPIRGNVSFEIVLEITSMSSG